MRHSPEMPMQHGWPITSHTMCSAIGHLVMSSGHSCGAIEAGASQYFGSRPHTLPEMRPPGPESPGDHFFHVEMTSDQHLAALLLEPNADRADPVAQQRQQQHQYLRRVDPVRKVRPVVVPVVQRVRPQQLDAVARRTSRVVQHALQYRARYALAVEELKHGVVAPGRNVLQMQLLLGRARPPSAAHERPVRLEHVDLVRIVRHWRTGQILLLLGRRDATARTILTTTRRHIEKHLILLHRHIVIVIVEGDVRRGKAAGPLLLPARHPVPQALHHKHQPAEHHARHGRFPLDQKLFAALVPVVRVEALPAVLLRFRLVLALSRQHVRPVAVPCDTSDGGLRGDCRSISDIDTDEIDSGCGLIGPDVCVVWWTPVACRKLLH
uniref:Uncharacterized protein n=1 Tax=Anopheles merus TaxID=30066 RepID=A0A182UVK5_ANOME